MILNNRNLLLTP